MHCNKTQSESCPDWKSKHTKMQMKQTSRVFTRRASLSQHSLPVVQLGINQTPVTELHLNSFNSSCLVISQMWWWWEGNTRWCCWVPFPLCGVYAIDVHGVVFALLKSSDIAEVDADFTCIGRTARESVRAGTLTLHVHRKWRRKTKAVC